MTCHVTKYGEGFQGVSVCECGYSRPNNLTGFVCPTGGTDMTVRVVIDPIAEAIALRTALDAATAHADAQAQLLRDAEAKIANQKLEIANLKASIQGRPKRGPDRPTDGNSALRRAGYVTIPRWWVTHDQLEVIERIANSNRDEVWRIKNGEP